jgi:hypothetical protein
MNEVGMYLSSEVSEHLTEFNICTYKSAGDAEMLKLRNILLSWEDKTKQSVCATTIR